MSTIIMAWSGYKTHIIDNVPQNGDPVKTRCGKTIKHYQLGNFGTEDCPKCGSKANYDEIHQELSCQAFLAEENRKKQHAESHERERIATEQRKEIAERLANFICSEFGGEIVGVDKWARCDNYILQIEGHKFELKAKL